MHVVLQTYPVLLMGAVLTLEITVLSVALGCILGLIAGLARLSTKSIYSYLARCYIDFFRGTPLLVQIFIIYFGIPQIFMQTQELLMANYGMPKLADSFVPPLMVAAVLSCGINSGAYIAEIFRAGVQSIERGQTEAARSLGMTQAQAMRFVILPQAFKRVIPPLGNEFIAMLKDTSLLSVIGIAELTRRGQLIMGQTYVAFPVLMTVAFLYLIMTLTFSRFVDYMERRLKTGD